MTSLARNPYLGDSRWRRIGVGVVVAICLVLALFPERYKAAVSLTPTDPTSLGLSAALIQFGAIGNVFGSQAAVEVALRVARSILVREIVIDKLDIIKTQGFAGRLEANRWLQRNVDVRVERGGIIEISVLNSDRKFGVALITAYTNATRRRLAEIGKQQTDYKRTILTELVEETAARRDKAQLEYDSFRRRTRFAQPFSAIGAIGERIPVLQSGIKDKEVQLNTARQFNTDNGLPVRQVLAELKALRLQLAEAQAVNPQEKDSVGMVIQESTKIRELERKLAIARGLYENYTRFLEGTSVEDLTQTAVVRILEPPFIESERQFNFIPLMIAILLALMALAVEFYKFRPPVGDRMGAP